MHQSLLAQLRHIQSINATHKKCTQFIVTLLRFNSQNAVVLEEHKNIVLEQKFIPMTKKTLIRKLVEQHHLIGEISSKNFKDFAQRLEVALSKDVHRSLSELKNLYDPLNPDKETMLEKHTGKKARLDQEFTLLQKLAKQLELANFQELPREYLAYNFAEHPVYEGVTVNVEMKKYDVLRFWVLGEETKSLSENWKDKIKNLFYSFYKQLPTSIPVYKRVVLAVRTKKQSKLMLKAFKDLPQNSLEYFLPEGKISMSLFDKRFLATTLTIGGLSVAVKSISFMANFNLQWFYIFGGVTGLLALQAWNAYKNKRNQYLVNISKSLYFKTIANNRALLTLITDRAGDELFKSALLSYVFIRMNNSMQEASVNENCNHVNTLSIFSTDELRTSVESWLSKRYNVHINYNPIEGLKKLEQLGLLKVEKKGLKSHLKVVSIDETLKILPSETPFHINHEEELEVEVIKPENDGELFDKEEKAKQETAEHASQGWN